jgi:hypothetical protein
MYSYHDMFYQASVIVMNRTMQYNSITYIRVKQLVNPLPSLTLQSARDLNVPCWPKRYKVLLLSYTFKCPLKKHSLSAHAVGL